MVPVVLVCARADAGNATSVASTIHFIIPSCGTSSREAVQARCRRLDVGHAGRDAPRARTERGHANAGRRSRPEIQPLDLRIVEQRAPGALETVPSQLE